MKFNESNMKVKLSTSQWWAYKADSKATAEFNASKGVGRDAGTYNKKLAPAEFLAEARSAFSALEKFHKRMTTPWDDDGWRILKCSAHSDYTEGVRKCKSKIRDAVDGVIISFPRFLENEKVRLKGLFKLDDYPKASEIDKKWGVRIKMKPIDDEDNVRMKISDDAIEEIKADIRSEREAAEKKTMEDLWNRLYEPVKKLADRLEEPELKGNKSLVNNIIDLVNLLPTINMFDNPELESMRREVEDKLCRHSVKDLKADSLAHYETKEAAKEIVERMTGYLK